MLKISYLFPTMTMLDKLCLKDVVFENGGLPQARFSTSGRLGVGEKGAKCPRQGVLSLT